MSWIQENKFAAGLAGATAVIGGAIFFFGYSQGNSYDKTMTDYKAASSKLERQERANPYPNAKNLAARKRGIEEYGRVIDDVRGTLCGFGPAELAKPSPKDFGDIRAKVHTELAAAFADAKSEVAKDCFYGFSKYSAQLPQAKATPQLTYQLGAVQWLLTELASVKPVSLDNIHRDLIAVEKGAPAPPKPTRSGRPRVRKPKKAVEKSYELMPMELTFTADENAVREFLKKMVNSKEYFYSIRAMRVRNSNQKPPNASDVSFKDGAATPVAPKSEDPFGGIALPDEDETPAEEGDPKPAPVAKKPVSSERILEQVLGKETLSVHICFDVVLVKPIKKDAKPAANNKPADGQSAAGN